MNLTWVYKGSEEVSASNDENKPATEGEEQRQSDDKPSDETPPEEGKTEANSIA